MAARINPYAIKPQMIRDYDRPLTEEDFETLAALNNNWKQLEIEQADLLVEADLTMCKLFGKRKEI